MFCKKCGFNLDDDAVFCSKCGTPLKSASIMVQDQTGPNANQNQSTDIYLNSQPLNQTYNQTQNVNPYPNMQQVNAPNYLKPSTGNYNYQQSPTGPKNHTTTIIIACMISVLLVGGLVLGGYMLFFRDSPSSSSTMKIDSVSNNKDIKAIIIGTWEVYDKNGSKMDAILRFESNGKCTVTENSSSSNSTYTVDEPDEEKYSRIKITGDRTFYVKIVNNDKLELKDGYYFNRKK